MLCDQVRENLSAYLDKELTADLSAAVRAHLETCDECRALADELRATVDLLGRLPARAAPKHVVDDVMREIERRGILAIGAPLEPQPQERTLPMRRARLWPRALAVAATLAMAAGIGIFGYLSSIQSPTESVDARKAIDAFKTPGGGPGEAGGKQAAQSDDYVLRTPAPASNYKTTVAADRDHDSAARRDKKTDWDDKSSLLAIKDTKGEASRDYSYAARGPAAVEQESAQPLTLAKAGTAAVAGDDAVAGGFVVMNGAVSGRALGTAAGAGQVALDLNGTNTYSGGTVLSLNRSGALGQLEVAAGDAIALRDVQVDLGGLIAVPVTPLFVAPPASAGWNLRLGEIAVPGSGGFVHGYDGNTVTLAAAPAKVDSAPKPGLTYFGVLGAATSEKAAAEKPAMPPPESKVAAGPYVAVVAAPAAVPPVAAAPAAAQPLPESMGRAKSAEVARVNERAASKPAPVQMPGEAPEAEFRRGLGEHGRETLEQVMVAAAGGEAGVDRLSHAVTGEALRAADNQLVLRVESPDEADRNLVELFKAAGWHALAVDRARSALNKEEAQEGRGATGGRSSSQAEGYGGKRLPPGGVYYRATRNGENVWLVLADRDSLARFGSRLAQAQGLAVGMESSSEFLSIRGLQAQLWDSEVAKAGESAPRIAGERNLGAGSAAMKPAAAVAGGRPRAESATTNELVAGKGAEGLKQSVKEPVKETELRTEGPKPATSAPAGATNEPARKKFEPAAPAASELPPSVAPAAPAEFPAVAAGDQPKKPTALYFREQDGGERGGGGGGGAGMSPTKGVSDLAATTMESKLKAPAGGAIAGAAPAPAAAPAAPDRILLVIRVQPVHADRAEAAPAATQPAAKP